MFRKLFPIIIAVALIGLMIGCSKDDSTTGGTTDSIADEFGGYLPTDEAPAFGDPELAADIEADQAYSDPMLAVSSVDSVIDESTEAGTYVMRILWGSMEYDSTVTEVTDWSGSLTISRGAEIVRRTIRFEPGQDYILDRTDRSLIEWVSLTTVHHDGICVNLYVPPVDSTDTTTAADEPVTVSFETGPFSISFDISEIAALDTIYYLDDEVNAVAFRGFKIYPGACPKGFLEGGWGTDSTGQGIFKGRWISQHGALAGFLEGTWGVDPDGNQTNVFYGKWIDLNGQFQGLLRGTYKPVAFGLQGNGHMQYYGGGWFRGNFYDKNQNVLGVLRGHYQKSRCDCDGRLGFFKGRWKTYCPSTTVDEVDDGLDG